MPTLVATLKSEVRKLSAKEIKRALRPLKRLQRQLKALRLVSRAQRRTVSRLERRISKLRDRAFSRGSVVAMGSRGPRVSPELIQSLRSRFAMTRVQFAKLLSVSPGSIFGWETGRTMPRGKSRARLMEVKKLGVRKARAAVDGKGRKARGGRAARRR
jgi:DNA-binding transcriptional regulator YiaG